MADPANLTATQALRAIESGALTREELLDACLARDREVLAWAQWIAAAVG